MEQQYDASGAPLAQAARTVLPGEPFDPPARSMVPGPRPAGQEPPFQPPTALMAEWNYDPGPPLYSPQMYAHSPTGQVTAQPGGGNDIDALGEYATLPPARPVAAATPPAPRAPQVPFAPQAPFAPQPRFAPQARFAPQPQVFAAAAHPAPPAAPARLVSAPMPAQGFGSPYPAAPAGPQAYPAYPPPDAPLYPLPPAPSHERHGRDPGKRRAGRKSPDRRLLAGALILVLAGGGYVGYTQLTKKSDAATTPVAPVVTAAPRYDFPAVLDGFSLQTGTAASAGQRQLRASAVAAYPGFGRASVASYGAGKSPVIAVSFHPATAKLSAAYSAVLAGVRKPAKGNVVGAFTPAIPGAAGGQMTCGGQQGVAPSSYCVWRGKSTVGMLHVAGTPNTQITQILTRELRAYAEH